MKRLVLFMHTTLDGFVAGPNGEMDWINVSEEMFDYAARETAEADMALYGRVTYGMMQAYWPTAADKPNATKHDVEHSTWYNSVTKVVISKTIQEQELEKTKIISDNVAEEIQGIKQQGGKNILMFGSPTVAHLLMQHDLIDDYWLFVNPVTIAEGIPLFAGSKHSLKLLSAKSFSSGVVAMHYGKKSED
jgi:dihydrofolate reductase